MQFKTIFIFIFKGKLVIMENFDNDVMMMMISETENTNQSSKTWTR